MMLSALNCFKEFIKNNTLFDEDDKILLAVSGGRDSVAMLHLFLEAGFNIGIAHCNFKLRGEESDRDENFVKTLADQHDLPFHIQYFDTIAYADEHKLSIQMAARALRYKYFYDVQDQYHYHKIAVGQHQNDAIETVLLNLIRGTGVAGLHGIKPERENIIRPLLCFTREQVDEIIEHNKLKYVEDSSNSSSKYVRNKIRLDIVPQMKLINPSLEETFNKNIEYFSALEGFVNHQIEKYRKDLFEINGDQIKINKLKLKSVFSLEFVLSELLLPLGFNKTAVQNLIDALDAETGRQFFSARYHITVDRQYVFINEFNEKKYSAEALLTENQEEINFKNFIFYQNLFPEQELKYDSENVAFVNHDKLIYPLKIRNWEQGDSFKPLGMKGMKKVSDFFIHKKIPLLEKKQVPLLINGDGNIIWIAGYRLDDRFKITSKIKKIIKFEFKSAVK